jgi:hypothetical protein
MAIGCRPSDPPPTTTTTTTTNTPPSDPRRDQRGPHAVSDPRPDCYRGLPKIPRFAISMSD